jgi:hypothetical protein
MSLIPRVAVTGAGHPGSRPTDKQATEDTEKHADTAVFKVAADSNASADSVDATAQDHGAAVCTKLPAMNAISPLASSSWHYKIAGEFLEAGIHYLREIHSREISVVEIMGATTNLPATAIILYLIDNPGERLEFNGKLPSGNKVNRADIVNECVDAEKQRLAGLNASSSNSDFSLEYQNGLPIFMRRDQHQSIHRLAGAFRSCA